MPYYKAYLTVFHAPQHGKPILYEATIKAPDRFIAHSLLYKRLKKRANLDDFQPGYGYLFYCSRDTNPNGWIVWLKGLFQTIFQRDLAVEQNKEHPALIEQLKQAAKRSPILRDLSNMLAKDELLVGFKKLRPGEILIDHEDVKKEMKKLDHEKWKRPE